MNETVQNTERPMPIFFLVWAYFLQAISDSIILAMSFGHGQCYNKPTMYQPTFFLSFFLSILSIFICFGVNENVQNTGVPMPNFVFMFGVFLGHFGFHFTSHVIWTPTHVIMSQQCTNPHFPCLSFFPYFPFLFAWG